ncbi:MAG: acetyl-CoA carboxylase, carboxyl transferase, beta subunit [Bacteroidetes bacterium]|nr:acetyl-CoA carboxylase, carboxyl transferase, beta subunit [Bacteroidota bacterium]
MAWFKRSKENIAAETQKKEIPDGMWVKCDECGEIIHKKELAQNLYTCTKCTNHFRIGSKEYIEILFDEGSFKEYDRKMRSADPLKFVDTKRYRDRIPEATKKTGLYDAVRWGTGMVNKKHLVLAAMDFAFIGGSMGSVVGEKIGRAIDKAWKTKTPLLVISASGGARMMEGALSLMQMAKTSAKLGRLANAGIPYISLMTDPTTGGVTASYAMLGDVNIAEPGALIGFAGPRVIKQTIGKDLPAGFQRSEFLLEHGFVDLVLHRKELKNTIAQLLSLLAP